MSGTGHMPIIRWFRQTLELVRRRGRALSIQQKLEVIRAAVQHLYPVSDIADMLSEIEGPSPM